jgi:hypothetical protein
VSVRSNYFFLLYQGKYVFCFSTVHLGDYTGNIIVILQNLSNKDMTFDAGSAIAQLVIMSYTPVQLFEVNSEEITHLPERGNQGFGSTEARRGRPDAATRAANLLKQSANVVVTGKESINLYF